MDNSDNIYCNDKNLHQYHRSNTAPSHEMICSFDKLSIKSSSISGSGYGSEAETEISLAEDTINHNQFDENDNTPSQNSIANMTGSLGKGTFSDLLGPSDSELFQVKKELVTNLHVIDDAEQMVTQALQNLQSLWLNIDSKASLPSLTNATQGQHKLIQKLTLISFVIKEMRAEWNAFAGNPLQANKLTSLENSNRLLQEQLESSRVIQSCLESELKYIEKEKSLLNEEIRELTLQIADGRQSLFPNDLQTLPKE
ncbi:unnamed protein product [Allacma fusca]|uniref:Uncharacterized protein n=1 Tax=Allacma fusca TaxID=39272 RepID=A0A8J2LJM8_9HEXA|nr:unnamed protein product [Allacma fusca]